MEARTTDDGRAELLVDELELTALQGALIAAGDDPALSAQLDLPPEFTAELVEDLLSVLRQAQANDPGPNPEPALVSDEPPTVLSPRAFRHWLGEMTRHFERARAEEDDRQALAARYLGLARHSSLWSETAVETVADQIQRTGHWEDTTEWRIFTTTAVRIEPKAEGTERFFEVTIDCDGVVQFRSPTLERALERLCVYDVIMRDLFWTSGWSSWAADGRLEAMDEEHTP